MLKAAGKINHLMHEGKAVNKMHILGIDPGYATLGYGIIQYKSNKFKPIYYGAVITEPDEKFSIRLEKLYDTVFELCQIYKPDAMAIEKLFFTTNQKTAINVAQARGVILLAAQKNNIPAFEYTPLQVKQSVVGYGKALKTQVMEMTKRLLCLEKVPKPDDTADALAVAICHAHSAGSRLNNLKY